MKKLALLLPLFIFGCYAQSPAIKSPRYFNQDVDILDYYATYTGTTWTLKAKERETMVLVFNYETIEIDFEASKDEPGEFIFTVSSQVNP